MDPTLPVSTQPTSPLSSITPVDPEKPVSKIWLWIVGGILLLGVGIVGGVVLGKQLYSVSQPQPISQPNPSPIVESTPAPDSTASQASNGDLANWKTYTNTAIGFQIRYPNNYHDAIRNPGVQGWAFTDTWGTVNFYKNLNENLYELIFFRLPAPLMIYRAQELLLLQRITYMKVSQQFHIPFRIHQRL